MWKWALGSVVTIFVVGGMYLSGCGVNLNPMMWAFSWYAYSIGPTEYIQERNHLCSFKPVTREDVMRDSSL